MTEFLKEEFLTSSLNGALQRAGIYAENATPKQRKDFREAMRSALRQFGERYKSEVLPRDHVDNIRKLAEISQNPRFRDFMMDRRPRIGMAQKALNLYLKYLWCVGEAHTPPHCPFDSRIISHLPPEKRRNWTEITDVKEYESLVTDSTETMKQDKFSSLSEWELEKWQREDP
jgi:hypothetical protein